MDGTKTNEAGGVSHEGSASGTSRTNESQPVLSENSAAPPITLQQYRMRTHKRKLSRWVLVMSQALVIGLLGWLLSSWWSHSRPICEVFATKADKTTRLAPRFPTPMPAEGDLELQGINTAGTTRREIRALADTLIFDTGHSRKERELLVVGQNSSGILIEWLRYDSFKSADQCQFAPELYGYPYEVEGEKGKVLRPIWMGDVTHRGTVFDVVVLRNQFAWACILFFAQHDLHAVLWHGGEVPRCDALGPDLVAIGANNGIAYHFEPSAEGQVNWPFVGVLDLDVILGHQNGQTKVIRPVDPRGVEPAEECNPYRLYGVLCDHTHAFDTSSFKRTSDGGARVATKSGCYVTIVAANGAAGPTVVLSALDNYKSEKSVDELWLQFDFTHERFFVP